MTITRSLILTAFVGIHGGFVPIAQADQLPYFSGMGIPAGASKSEAWDISADGSTVVGLATVTGGDRPFVWTMQGGFQLLPNLPGGPFGGIAIDVSGDGSVINGICGPNGSPDMRSCVWATPDYQPTSLHSEMGAANKIDKSGEAVVGWRMTPQGARTYRWTQSSGVVELITLSGYLSSFGTGISGSGLRLIGAMESSQARHAFVVTWGNAPQIVHNPAYSDTLLWDLALDGTAGAGLAYYNSGLSTCAARWVEGEFVQCLPAMVPIPALSNTDARVISADGRTILGFGFDSMGQQRAFIWTEGDVVRNLKDVLQSQYGLALPGWDLYAAQGISEDGLTIAGYGRNPSGQTEAWVACIPEPTTASLILMLAIFGNRRIPRRSHRRSQVSRC